MLRLLNAFLVYFREPLRCQSKFQRILLLLALNRLIKRQWMHAHTQKHTRTHNPHTRNWEQSVFSDGGQAYLCTMHSPHLCHKFNFDLLSFRSFVFWNLLWCQFSKFIHIASWRRVRVACFNGIEMIFSPFELITCHIHKQVPLHIHM